MITLPFLLTTLILTLLPGPGVLYTVSTAINKGRSSSYYAVIGCCLGILPHLALGVIVIGLMHQLPTTMMTGVKYIGAAYLLYMGVGMFRTTGSSAIKDTIEHNTVSNRAIIIKGILLNLLNPKLTLFFISFLPQFILARNPSPIYQAILLGFFTLLFTFPVFILYGTLASALNRWLLTSPLRLTWMNRVFGGMFILFAVNLFR